MASRITTWSNGQILTAAALNGEFDEIFTNITNANIAAGAAIAASKLDLENMNSTIRMDNNVQIQFENAAGAADGRIFENGSNVLILQMGDANRFVIQNDGGASNLYDFQSTWFGSRGSRELRIYDGDDSDYIRVDHDGTDGQISTTLGDIQLTAASGQVELRTGNDLVVRDATNADDLTLAHDGTNATITNSGDLYFTPAGGQVELRTGTDLVVRDATNADDLTLSHDGTNAAVTNSGDLYLTPTGGDVAARSGTKLKAFNAGNTDSIDLYTTAGGIATLESTGAAQDLKLIAGQDLQLNASGQIYLTAASFVSLQAGTDLKIQNAAQTISSIISQDSDLTVSSGGNILLEADAGGKVQIRDGSELTIQNDAQTLETTMYQDTSMHMEAAGDILLSATGGDVQLRSGTDLQLNDGDNSDYMELYHDGTHGKIDTTTGDIHLNPDSGEVEVRSGSRLFLRDPGNSDVGNLYHDGTYLRIETTNSSDVRFAPDGGNVYYAAHNKPILDNTYHCGTGAGGGGTLAWANVSSYAYVTASDERIKENITPVSSALDKINQLEPINYAIKGDRPMKNGKRTMRMGLTAQNVKQVLPNIVYDPTEDPDLTPKQAADANMGIRYQELIPVLVKAIQELEARV